MMLTPEGVGAAGGGAPRDSRMELLAWLTEEKTEAAARMCLPPTMPGPESAVTEQEATAECHQT